MSELISIYEAERLAQTMGFDSTWMTLVAPSGKETRVQWLDAYMGLVMYAGGHISSQQLAQMGLKAKDVSLTEEVT